ncbi:transport and Golgi organization protein 2 homolog [Crassostrea virginica]
MCVLFLYYNDNPDSSKYRLILASNRDEKFDRPTKALDFWGSTKICLSGQDSQNEVEGSTWLGMTKTGKVAILLNILGPADTSSPQTDVAYFNNRENDLNCRDVPMDNNCICLSNAKSAKTPFQKVAKGREKFIEIVENFNYKDKKSELTEKLLELLRDKTKYADDPVLQSQAESTVSEGNETNFAKNRDKLSSLYVYIPELGYGTRTHSIITMDFDGHCEYLEKTLLTPVDEEDMQWNDTLLKFDIETE